MKKLFFSLTALLMFSATSVAKTIEIEPTEMADENSLVLKENFSNVEDDTQCVGKLVELYKI